MDEKQVYIVVIVCLVGVLGVAGGYILSSKFTPQTTLPVVNYSTGNNTNQTGNNSTATTSKSSTPSTSSNAQSGSNSNSNSQITESQALTILNQEVGNNNYVYSGFSDGNYNFEVPIPGINHDYSSYSVNAQTGEVY